MLRNENGIILKNGRFSWNDFLEGEIVALCKNVERVFARVKIDRCTSEKYFQVFSLTNPGVLGRVQPPYDKIQKLEVK